MDTFSHFLVGLQKGKNVIIFIYSRQKILICSPLPIKMYIEEHGRMTLIYSGAELWGYKVFGASNFLRCLEYNVIEK